MDAGQGVMKRPNNTFLFLILVISFIDLASSWAAPKKNQSDISHKSIASNLQRIVENVLLKEDKILVKALGSDAKLKELSESNQPQIVRIQIFPELDNLLYFQVQSIRGFLHFWVSDNEAHSGFIAFPNSFYLVKQQPARTSFDWLLRELLPHAQAADSNQCPKDESYQEFPKSISSLESIRYFMNYSSDKTYQSIKEKAALWWEKHPRKQELTNNSQILAGFEKNVFARHLVGNLPTSAEITELNNLMPDIISQTAVLKMALTSCSKGLTFSERYKAVLKRTGSSSSAYHRGVSLLRKWIEKMKPLESRLSSFKPSAKRIDDFQNVIKLPKTEDGVEYLRKLADCKIQAYNDSLGKLLTHDESGREVPLTDAYKNCLKGRRVLGKFGAPAITEADLNTP